MAYDSIRDGMLEWEYTNFAHSSIFRTGIPIYKNKPLYTIGTKLKINSRNSTFNISLPKDATLDGDAYIYEI